MRYVWGTHPTAKGRKYTGEGLKARQESLAKARAQSPSYKKKGKRLAVVCEICGKRVWLLPSIAKRQKYCSLECLHRSQVGREISDEQKKAISKAQKDRFQKNPRSNPFFGRTPSNFKGWGYGGYVPELGFSVRSTWEREYLVALKEAGVEFQYEPKRFDLETSTYLPDLQLSDTVFVEITGWDKPGKAEKREKFRQMYGHTLLVWKERPSEKAKADFVRLCKGVMP